MKKIHEYIFIIIGLVFVNTDVLALSHYSTDLITAWGHRPQVYSSSGVCNKHNPGNACIGKGADICEKGKMNSKRGNYELGIIMLVAYDRNSHGATFYPAKIAENDCWATVSRRILNYSQWGVRLCKKGFSGHLCSSNNVHVCNSTSVTRDRYSIINPADFDNTSWDENSLATFYPDSHWSRDCSDSKNGHNWRSVETTSILAVENFEPNGHGAFVRPYIWRVVSNKSLNECSVAVSPMEDEPAQLWCAEGYTQNADDTECVPVKVELCNKWCDGWTLDGYNANKTERMLYYSEAGDCLQSRCKASTKAFDPSTWKCSVDCIKDSRNGISPDDGTCVTCPDGEIFDKEAKEGSSSFCKKATVLGASSLQYGSNGQNKDFKNQCWAKEDPAEYKNCVLGIVPEQTDSDAEE